MSPRLSVFAGLLAGVVTAVLVLGGILVYAPQPMPAATPAPQPSVAASAAAGASASAGAETPAAPGSSAAAPPAPSTSATPSGAAVSAGASSSTDLGALSGIGASAPPLVVPKLGGGTIDLANLQGKPVWVNFMGTYCPPCVDELPLMNGFAERYADQGLVVVAVDVKEDEGTVAAFAEALGATFPIGLDGDGSAADAWKAAAALPAHFWVDKDGIVRDAAAGGIGPDVMARGLGTILPDVTVTP